MATTDDRGRPTPRGHEPQSGQPRQPQGVPAGGEFTTTTKAEAAIQLLERPHQQQTPTEIDSRLAELYKERAALKAATTSALDDAHYLLGHRKQYLGRSSRGTWALGSEETLTQLAATLEEGALRPWDADRAGRVLVKVDELRAADAVAGDAMGELDAEFRARGGWSRFFLVTSSDGHIHSSTSCHTCRPTTEFGWLPELSGQAEPDAVAEHGAILCTACYPSAPVEWTCGKPEADDTCPGSNRSPAGDTRRVGRSFYGECQECGQTQTVGYSGVRKHKRPA